MMDFITLATETDPRRLLRHLTDVLGDDDDVAYPAASAAGTSSSSYTDPSPSSVESGQKPFLSKTAEAELYLLATNFLLYVAMVIIATLVGFKKDSRSICIQNPKHLNSHTASSLQS